MKFECSKHGDKFLQVTQYGNGVGVYCYAKGCRSKMFLLREQMGEEERCIFDDKKYTIHKQVTNV